ncbi:MAG: histidine kinase [Desulfuromonas sp.]|nr:MAG: histidine kinase [Desulfuromonas sp.]
MTEIQPSANLFEAIVGNLSSGLYVVQGERAIYLNEHFGRFFGLGDAQALIGANMFRDVYPDAASRALFQDIHQQMLDKQMSETSWAQIAARKDGTPFWLEVEARLIKIDGEPAILGVFKDQTECQMLSHAMHVSQETLRLLLDAMEDRVYVVTDDYRIVYANKKMRDGCLGDIDTEPCYLVCRGLESECDDCAKDEVFRTGRPSYKEFFNQVTQRWYSVVELAIRMPDVDRPAKLAVARDITARRESEGRVRGLTHRLMSVQEEERKRLSRDLHDDLGQRLNAVKMGIESLGGDGSIGAEARVVELSEMLQGAIESVRQLSAGLRPPVLERYGLVRTVREHCERLSTLHGLRIDFQAPGMKDVSLGGRTEIKLFRVVQEAVNNALRHAEASVIKVRLIASYPSVRLRIEDDGKGFEPQHVTDLDDRPRFGLLGMSERVELLGGKFHVDSRPGQGTRVTVELPDAAQCAHCDE